MKDSDDQSIQEFSIKKFLIGYSIGILAGIIIFIITEHFAVSIAVMTALGVTIGISIEQRSRKSSNSLSKKSKIRLFTLLGVGILLFIFSVIFYYFIQ